jgi:hypothetical protein
LFYTYNAAATTHLLTEGRKKKKKKKEELQSKLEIHIMIVFWFLLLKAVNLGIGEDDLNRKSYVWDPLQAPNIFLIK